MFLIIVLLLLLLAAAAAAYVSWKQLSLPWLRLALAAAAALSWLVSLLLPEGAGFSGIFAGQAGEASLLPEVDLVVRAATRPLGLAVPAVLFLVSLERSFSLSQTAWAYALGAGSLFALLAGNTYSLLMGWALIELIWLGYCFFHQREEQRSTYLNMPFAVRLLGPGLLIYGGLIAVNSGAEGLFSGSRADFLPLAAAASVFRWGIWLPTGFLDGSREHHSFHAVLAALPSGVSFSLIAQLSEVGFSWSALEPGGLVLSALLLLTGAVWAAGKRTGEPWKLFFFGLISLSYLGAGYQLPSASISFGLGMLLSGLLLFFPGRAVPLGWVRVGVIGLGLLPLPFFPLAGGAVLFTRGWVGMLSALGMGLLLAGAGQQLLRAPVAASPEKNLQGLNIIPAWLLLLITQITAAIWLLPNSPEAILPGWDWRFLIPLAAGAALTAAIKHGNLNRKFPVLTGLWDDLYSSLYKIGKFLESLVGFILGLLEGRGGLIWTLLIGFLILTLLNLQGGR
jgi:hypothetical protein